MFQKVGVFEAASGSSPFRIRWWWCFGLGVNNISAVLLIFLLTLLVCPLAGLQCFHCKDLMRQEFGPNSSEPSGNHSDHCGTLRATGRLECPGASLCSKITVYYKHNSTDKVKQVIRRSCWATTEKMQNSGRNYSSGNCYKDPVSSRPYDTQVCVCAGDYCNSENSLILTTTTTTSLIKIIANLLITHFCRHRMLS